MPGLFRHLVTALCALALFWTAAAAPGYADEGGRTEGINAVASIRPVHSLLARVMEGAGRPRLLVTGGRSAHAYALKPSDARALATARAVFWIGPELEGFLVKPFTALGRNVLAVELLRAEKLGIPYVVAHPGAFTTSSEEEGIERIIEALDTVHRQTDGIRAQALLENTAGQGSNLGWRFEHLAAIIAGVAQSEKLGVCIDTCHTFAAGYPLGTRKQYQATIDELDRVVGLKRVKAFHLNDSKQPLGSRVDRHEHIGRGKLGLAPFKHLLRDPRFGSTPMYLETPKEEVDGQQMDVVNLRTLRALARAKD